MPKTVHLRVEAVTNAAESRRHHRAEAGESLSLANSLAKSGFSGNPAASSLSCLRATSVFFSRRAASASKIFANGRR